MARWQEYEEKQDLVQNNEELLINSWWIVKRIKAEKFKWEKWEKGETGPKWDNGIGSGDLLAKNNLSDLRDKGAARQNLDVFSKTEINEKLNNKVEKISWKSLSTNDFTNELKNKLDWYNSYYQEVEDIRWTNRAPNDSFWKNQNIHFWFDQCEQIGLPGNWATLTTYNAWDAGVPNAHPVHQIALTNEGFYWRRQKTATEWWPWLKVYTQEQDINVSSGPDTKSGLINLGNKWVGGHRSAYIYKDPGNDLYIQNQEPWYLYLATNNATRASVRWDWVYSEVAQGNGNNALTRKDYVDNLVRNSANNRLVYDSWDLWDWGDIDLTHNLNISADDIAKFRYHIILKYSGWIVDNIRYYDDFNIYGNTLRFSASRKYDWRRILIFKNY